VLHVPNELASRLEPLVAEAVTTAGFDLDSLEVQQAGRRQLVKVVVDSDDGIGLDEVAEVSRKVSAVLEVTSPGLDRPLTQPRHWRRAKFRLVRIIPAEGAEYVARVGHAGQEAARVLAGGSLQDVAYASVAKAVVEIEFKQPPAEDLKLLEEDASGPSTAAGQNEPKEESK
jgi:ribosome maturation factor RimP